MDHAVALVDAYLQINGYLTVAEYPVIESVGKQKFQTATDVDILAFRFPGAGRIITGKENDHSIFAPDTALSVSGDEADMIIGEVKEGRAELNKNAINPNVLRIVLARFGCCSIEQVDPVVDQLISKGKASTHDGHHIRLVAFGSIDTKDQPYEVITIGHIIQFIENYLFEHWAVLRNTQFKHPALGLFMVMQKARMNMKEGEP